LTNAILSLRLMLQTYYIDSDCIKSVNL